MKLCFHVLLLCLSALNLKSSFAWTLSLISDQEDPCIPNQVHVSLGDAYYNALSNGSNMSTEDNSNSSVFIIWQTKLFCDNTYLSIKSNDGFSLQIQPNDIWYEMINKTIDEKHNEGPAGTYISYSHTAMIKDLSPRVNYTYEVLQTNGSNSAGPFSFNLPHSDTGSENTKILIYADIDTAFDNVTVNTLNNLAKTNPLAFDFQLFLGDLGYNIYTETGKRGEYFFNTAQPFLATWPFMMTAGNHENYQNYSFLNFRNRMPLYNKTNNHYYSFNVGKMHLVGINYYFYEDNPEIQETMLQWIEDDLKAANADRENRPWIIVFSHQPVYCSYSSTLDPGNKRCYAFAGKNEHWEDLYYKYNVDIVLQGHVHYWERTGPVYRNQSAGYASWSPEDRNHSIINAKAPIYTIEGSAGNSYFMVADPSPLADYSINYDLNLAYSTLSVVNDSALYYEHVKSSDGSMIDYFYLLKGPLYPIIDETPNGNVFSNHVAQWIILGVLLALLLASCVGYRRYKAKKQKNEDLYKAMTQDRETELQV